MVSHKYSIEFEWKAVVVIWPKSGIRADHYNGFHSSFYSILNWLYSCGVVVGLSGKRLLILWFSYSVRSMWLSNAYPRYMKVMDNNQCVSTGSVPIEKNFATFDLLSFW